MDFPFDFALFIKGFLFVLLSKVFKIDMRDIDSLIWLGCFFTVIIIKMLCEHQNLTL